MNPVTIEWAQKAEDDHRAARMLFRARKHPNYDGACFHAQQCVEKYMKAVLCEERRNIDRIHDLSKLLNQLVTINPFWNALRGAAEPLSNYAVRFRYPGSSADKVMAMSAIRHCDFIRGQLRDHLGFRPATNKKARTRTTKRRRRK